MSAVFDAPVGPAVVHDDEESLPISPTPTPPSSSKNQSLDAAPADGGGEKREKLDINEMLTVVEGIRMFADCLPSSARRQIAAAFVRRRFAAGETIVRGGVIKNRGGRRGAVAVSDPPSFFIVESGEVAKHLGGQTETLKAGGWFGTAALMSGAAAERTVMAVSDVCCLAIDGAAARSLLEKHSGLTELTKRKELVQEVKFFKGLEVDVLLALSLSLVGAGNSFSRTTSLPPVDDACGTMCRVKNRSLDQTTEPPTLAIWQRFWQTMTESGFSQVRETFGPEKAVVIQGEMGMDMYIVEKGQLAASVRPSARVAAHQPPPQPLYREQTPFYRQPTPFQPHSADPSGGVACTGDRGRGGEGVRDRGRVLRRACRADRWQRGAAQSWATESTPSREPLLQLLLLLHVAARPCLHYLSVALKIPHPRHHRRPNARRPSPPRPTSSKRWC